MSNNFSIFISHVSEDEAIAIILKNTIERIFLNSDVFVSGSDLKGGEVWVNEIKKKLDHSSVIIALLSDYSINSNWVLFESGSGFIGNKTIPFCIPSIKLANLTPPLSLLHAREMTEEGIVKLFQDIAKIVNLRTPDKISGITEFIDEINKFLILRRSSRNSIEELSTNQKSKKTKSIPQNQKPDETITQKIKQIETQLKDFIITQLSKVDSTSYDIPPLEELKKLDIDELNELSQYTNLPFDTFIITNFSIQKLTIPSTDAPHWKKINKLKALDSTLDKIKKLQEKTSA